MANIFLKSLGCNENDHFLSKLGEELAKSGFDCEFKQTLRMIVDFDKEKVYDFLVMASCTVVDYCNDFMINYLREFKQCNRNSITILSGCSLENNNSLSKLKGSKLINNFCRTQEEILSLIMQTKPAGTLKSQKIDPSPYVLLKSGCKNYCSYCIVPYVRKPMKVYSANNILNDIKYKEKNSINEIVLTGSCIGDWKDTESDMDFTELIESILLHTGVSISELYLNPKDCNRKLLSLFPHQRLPKGFSLPVQSGCDRTLKAMKRGYTVSFLRGMFEDMRRQIPGFYIAGTDIMIGFPTEMKADFEDTLSFIGEGYFRFVRGIIFNPRPKTAASKMPQLSKYTTMKRADRLLEFCSKHKIKCEVTKESDTLKKFTQKF